MTHLEIYAAARTSLKNPGLAVRCREETVEVFGYPPLTEVSNRTYPCWHFAGKISDFTGTQNDKP